MDSNNDLPQNSRGGATFELTIITEQRQVTITWPQPNSQGFVVWGETFHSIPSLFERLEVWQKEYGEATFRNIWIDAAYAINALHDNIKDVIDQVRVKLYELALRMPGHAAFEQSTTWNDHFTAYKTAYAEENKKRVNSAEETIRKTWKDLGLKIFHLHSSQGYHRALGRLANKVPDVQKARQWLNLAVHYRVTNGGRGKPKTGVYCPVDVVVVLRWQADLNENKWTVWTTGAPRELTSKELQDIGLEFTVDLMLQRRSKFELPSKAFQIELQNPRMIANADKGTEVLEPGRSESQSRSRNADPMEFDSSSTLFRRQRHPPSILSNNDENYSQDNNSGHPPSAFPASIKEQNHNPNSHQAPERCPLPLVEPDCAAQDQGNRSSRSELKARDEESNDAISSAWNAKIGTGENTTVDSRPEAQYDNQGPKNPPPNIPKPSGSKNKVQNEVISCTCRGFFRENAFRDVKRLEETVTSKSRSELRTFALGTIYANREHFKSARSLPLCKEHGNKLASLSGLNTYQWTTDLLMAFKAVAVFAKDEEDWNRASKQPGTWIYFRDAVKPTRRINQPLPWKYKPDMEATRFIKEGIDFDEILKDILDFVGAPFKVPDLKQQLAQNGFIDIPNVFDWWFDEPNISKLKSLAFYAKAESDRYRYHLVSNNGPQSAICLDQKFSLFQQAMALDPLLYLINVCLREDHHIELVAFPRPVLATDSNTSSDPFYVPCSLYNWAESDGESYNSNLYGMVSFTDESPNNCDRLVSGLSTTKVTKEFLVEYSEKLQELRGFPMRIRSDHLLEDQATKAAIDAVNVMYEKPVLQDCRMPLNTRSVRIMRPSVPRAHVGSGSRLVFMPTYVAIHPEADGTIATDSGLTLFDLATSYNYRAFLTVGPFGNQESGVASDPWFLETVLRGVSSLSEAMIGFKQFTDPDVVCELKVLFGKDRSRFRTYLHNWRDKLSECVIERYQIFEANEKATYGDRSFTKQKIDSQKPEVEEEWHETSKSEAANDSDMSEDDPGSDNVFDQKGDYIDFRAYFFPSDESELEDDNEDVITAPIRKRERKIKIANSLRKRFKRTL
ncbi:hypothetical protein DTO169E5_4842 [Paecilomyces variotii]|nr:hypothetical protein DTO169E5_4842 [Paecilomyces variotii]